LSRDRNLPQLAIELDSFTRALDSGTLDTCLHYLRQEDADRSGNARRNRQLGEALYHCGRGVEALECGRRAFAAAADDNEIAHFCAWLFSNCGCHGEAAVAYQQLIEHDPDWVDGYRHASGSLAAIGATEDAIALGMRASDLAPARFEFSYHVGGLLLAAGHYGDAARYLRRAVALEPNNPHALHDLSAAFIGLGYPEEALDLALHATALAPEDANIAIHAAELLLRQGRSDEAVAILTVGAETHPENARLWRVLSGAEAQRDHVQAALVAVDHALMLASDTAEYHLHRGHLLYGIGDFSGAAAAFNQAAEIDPASQAGKRAQLGVLLADGRITEATSAGGELLRAFPEDTASAQAVLHVLNRRLDTIDGDFVVLGERAARKPRGPRTAPGFGERLLRQARVLHALMIRETRTRFGDSRLGYGWALLEPVLHIAMLSAVFSLLIRGRPPIGTQFFIFYYTGLIRYYGARDQNPGSGAAFPTAIIADAQRLRNPSRRAFQTRGSRRHDARAGREAWRVAV
jgi:tetratricopeptide (TPR) repeat protein